MEKGDRDLKEREKRNKLFFVENTKCQNQNFRCRGYPAPEICVSLLFLFTMEGLLLVCTYSAWDSEIIFDNAKHWSQLHSSMRSLSGDIWTLCSSCCIWLWHKLLSILFRWLSKVLFSSLRTSTFCRKWHWKLDEVAPTDLFPRCDWKSRTVPRLCGYINSGSCKWNNLH